MRYTVYSMYRVHAGIFMLVVIIPKILNIPRFYCTTVLMYKEEEVQEAKTQLTLLQFLCGKQD